MQRLTILKRNRADEQFLARRGLRELPEAIDRLTQRLRDLSADQAAAAAHAESPASIGGRAVPRSALADALGERLDALPMNVGSTRRVPLGLYRGLRFGMVLHPQFPAEVYLERAAVRQVALSRDHQGPRAVLNALERLASGYGPPCDSVRQEIAITEAQLRDYRARLHVPYPHEAYLSQLAALRDQLRAWLSGGTPEPQAGIPEIAGRIKALRAANAVEGTPDRAPRRRKGAEEPIAARIRRRAEIAPAEAESPVDAVPDAETSGQAATASLREGSPGDPSSPQKPERPGWRR